MRSDRARAASALMVLIAAMVGLMLASTAQADVPKPTNGVYISRITHTQGLGPVRFSVTRDGSGYMTIYVPKGHTAIVGGYQGEYYLGIGRAGWAENEQSETWHTNNPSDPLNPGTGVTWRYFGSPSRTIRIHDHRLHWMTNPPVGTGDGRVVKLQDFHVPLLVDGHKARVDGEVLFRFQPIAATSSAGGSSSMVWMILAGVGIVVGLGVLAGVKLFRRAPGQVGRPTAS
jgi:hypothetical protein